VLHYNAAWIWTENKRYGAYLFPLTPQLCTTPFLETLLNLLPHCILVSELDLLKEVRCPRRLVLTTDVFERGQIVTNSVLERPTCQPQFT
jgi:hypothetical protein